MKKISKFLKRKILFVLAFILSGFYRACILIVPFRHFAKTMGEEKAEYNKEYKVSANERNKIRGIQRAVYEASRYTPWESLCMVKALTAMTMLKFRKINTVLFLGLGKDEEKNLSAHAWLSKGDYIITGGETSDKYSVITWYVNK